MSAVLVAHLGGGLAGPASSGTSVLPAIDTGARGVDLFFVLSGFLITGILYDSRGQSGFFTNFYARRALRIFPLYYGVLFVTLVLWPILDPQSTWQQPAMQHAPWLWTYTSNLLIAWKGEWCFGAFDHFWSLAVEEQFYLAWPLVIATLSRRPAIAASAILFLVGVTSRVWWAGFGGNDVTLYTLTLFRLDTLAAGACIALIARGSDGMQPLVRPAKIAFAVCSVLLVALTILDRRLLTVKDTLWTIEFSSFLVLMVTATPASFFHWLSARQVLKLLGKYSYGIYVYSTLLIWIAAPWLTARGFAEAVVSPLLGQFSYLAAMSALTIGTAFISWHCFEKHFLSLKRLFPTA